MKGVINQWLNQNAHVQGVLGGAVRCSEEMLMLPSSSAGVTPQNLENALRCVADTFQILERNRLRSRIWKVSATQRKAFSRFCGVTPAELEGSINISSEQRTAPPRTPCTWAFWLSHWLITPFIVYAAGRESAATWLERTSMARSLWICATMRESELSCASRRSKFPSGSPWPICLALCEMNSRTPIRPLRSAHSQA